MIASAELHAQASREGLRFDQAEKDYVILWLLSTLQGPTGSPAGWIFKGGTCLRHCYYTGYRFSEDIDFSCTPEAGGLDQVTAAVSAACTRMQVATGIRLQLKPVQTVPGDFQIEIPVEYSRGGPRRQGLPGVKVHLTFDEPIVTPICQRTVRPTYSDLKPFDIRAYSLVEIVAEKMRALIQQQAKWPRPRDLYDLWFVLCHKAEHLPRSEVRQTFDAKCVARKLAADPAKLTSSHLKEWNRKAWSTVLGVMMRELPNYETVWAEWTNACEGFFERK